MLCLEDKFPLGADFLQQNNMLYMGLSQSKLQCVCACVCVCGNNLPCQPAQCCGSLMGFLIVIFGQQWSSVAQRNGLLVDLINKLISKNNSVLAVEIFMGFVGNENITGLIEQV